MKRTITSALLALLALPALATSWKGDVNGDGQVDMADMVAMAKAINSGDADKTKYDLNASGSVDDADLHFLANLIIGDKLIEDSGLSIGIGGWDDAGEDFGGTVGAPPKKAGPANLRFYFSDPKYIHETSETYSTMGIESADNMPCGILIDIEPGWGMVFDNHKYFELLSDSPVLDGHVVYGAPKTVGDDGRLRFIIFSKDLNPLKGIGEIGNLFYNCDRWTSITISGQTVNADSNTVDDIEGQWIGKEWQYILVNDIWIPDWSIPGWDIYPGDTFGLQVEFDPWEASDKSLTWTSSDIKVAEVSGSGEYVEVRAVGVGKCIIQAQSVDNPNATATYELTVHPRFVEGIKITSYRGEMTEGETYKCSIEMWPDDATDKSVTWTSDNASVANVATDGTVTAVAPGNTTIRVKANDGSGAEAKFNLTVKEKDHPVTSIDLNVNNAEIYKGSTYQLTATVNPSNATNKGVHWSSSDNSVATVDGNGIVTGVDVGVVNITATAMDGSGTSASATIAVLGVPVSSLKLNTRFKELYVDESFTLIAIVLPDNAENKNVIWSSSNPEVATVDDNGKVKAIALGEAIITAKTTDGSNLTATCDVNVNSIRISDIKIVCEKTEIKIGETMQLAVEINPWNATSHDVEWGSDDEGVLTVSEDGMVCGIAVGYTLVWAYAKDGSYAEDEVMITVIDPKDGVESIGDGAKISVIGNELHIAGLNSGTRVTVCQTSGNMVHDAKADGDAMNIVLPSRGVYLITIGARTHKIMI